MSEEGSDPTTRSPAGDALTEMVMRTFRLNGLFLQAAEAITRPTRLTPARWQVLGAVLREPRTVSGIARVMGLTRQSVQRLADALVEDGLAELEENPAHRRARLLRPTKEGWRAIEVIRPRQYALMNRIGTAIPEGDLRSAVETMDRVIAALELEESVAGE